MLQEDEVVSGGEGRPSPNTNEKQAAVEPVMEAPEAPAGGAGPEARRSGAAPPDAAVLEFGEQIRALSAVVEEANRLSAHRERIIDRLHEENQKLRAGDAQRLLAPVLRDLVALYDQLHSAGNAYDPAGEVKAADVVKQIHLLRDVVSDVLYRHGVERFEAEPGAVFDTKLHKAFKAVPTDDPARERTIARVLRAGFQAESKVLRPLEAEVYRHTPKQP